MQDTKNIAQVHREPKFSIRRFHGLRRQSLCVNQRIV